MKRLRIGSTVNVPGLGHVTVIRITRGSYGVSFIGADGEQHKTWLTGEQLGRTPERKGSQVYRNRSHVTEQDRETQQEIKQSYGCDTFTGPRRFRCGHVGTKGVDGGLCLECVMLQRLYPMVVR